jgi:ribose transport system substrate-binding protein
LPTDAIGLLTHISLDGEVAGFYFVFSGGQANSSTRAGVNEHLSIRYSNIMKLTIAIVAVALLITGCGRKQGDSGASSDAQHVYTIAVIPKGTTHVYWRSLHAGAETAARNLGVQIIWKGPLLENDRAQQIDLVEQFAGQGVDAIVLAPLDNVALRRPVDEAMAKHIPVVICDSALEGEAGKDYVSYVSTDNHKGGEMGGDQLAKILGGNGKVILLRYGEGSASTLEREAGFLDAMAKNPGIQILVQNRYGGPTIGDSKDTALQMSDQLQQADGIFCSNESTASGMLLALRQLGLAGKVKFVGFDTSKMLLDALKAGEINALVAQNPRKMGNLAVQQAVAAIKGQPTTPRIDSGAALVTADNLNDPAIQQYLEVQ